MKLGLLFEIHQTLQDLSDHTGTDQNQHHYWNKKFVISWFLWDKLYKSLISMLKSVKLYALSMVLLRDYTGKITEIDNNKVKMIISMFGNDTVAEVNLNQIAEL